MADHNISVEEILAEIDRLSGKHSPEVQKNGDMARVDDIIRGILTEKKEEKLGVKKDSLTPAELDAFEKIVEEHTKTLTIQFEKLRAAEAARPSPEPLPAQEPVPLEETAQDSSVNPQVAAAFSAFEHAVAAFTDSDIREKGELAKTQVSPENYVEYRSKRNQRVDQFNLEPQKPPREKTPPALIEEEKPMPPEDIAAEDLEYESSAQAEEVTTYLEKKRRIARILSAVLGGLAGISLLLCFCRSEGESLLLFGKIALRPLSFLWIQTGLLAAGIAANFPMFREMLDAMFEHETSKSGFCAVASLVTLFYQLVLCFQSQALGYGAQLFVPAALLVLWANAVSRSQNAKRAFYNFEIIRTEPHMVVERMEDIPLAKSMSQGILDTEEEPAVARSVRADFSEGFLQDAFARDDSDALLGSSLWIALAFGIILGVFQYMITRDLIASLQFLPASLLLWHGILGAVVVSLPLWGTAGVARLFRGTIPGKKMIEEFSDLNTAMVNADTLFSDGAVVLHGIKTFQGKRIDYAIVDAASVVCASGSVLQQMFLEIINQRRDLLKPVDTIQYEDLMGVSAWVDNRRVLIGNRELLINHSVAVPKEDYEERFRENGNEVIYLATEGELCAAFIVSFDASHVEKEALQTFTENGISVLIKTVDACVSTDLVGRLFELEEASFKILPSRFHREWEAQLQPEERTDSLLCHDGTPLGFAISSLLPRKLHRCITFGKILHFIAGGLATVLLFCAAVLGHPEWIGGYAGAAFLLGMGLIYWIYQKNIRI